MSTIRKSPYTPKRILDWHFMKRGGKRYERWRRIRPMLDGDVGDNSYRYKLKKSRARRNNRDLDAQCGAEC